MNLIIQQYVHLKDKHKFRDSLTARKLYADVDFLPRIGDAIEDSVYHRNDPAYTVTEASFNYEENYYLAYLETVSIDSEDRNIIEERKEIYKAHG
ncbi:hypothetical protein, partial [Paenibacillus riograndensis]